VAGSLARSLSARCCCLDDAMNGMAARSRESGRERVAHPSETGRVSADAADLVASRASGGRCIDEDGGGGIERGPTIIRPTDVAIQWMTQKRPRKRPTGPRHLRPLTNISKWGRPLRLPIHTEAESNASVDHVPAGAVTSEPPSNPPAGFPPFFSVPEAAGSAGRAAPTPPAASLTKQIGRGLTAIDYARCSHHTEWPRAGRRQRVKRAQGVAPTQQQTKPYT
jgi:hypothetical protein